MAAARELPDLAIYAIMKEGCGGVWVQLGGGYVDGWCWVAGEVAPEM